MNRSKIHSWVDSLRSRSKIHVAIMFVKWITCEVKVTWKSHLDSLSKLETICIVIEPHCIKNIASPQRQNFCLNNFVESNFWMPNIIDMVLLSYLKPFTENNILLSGFRLSLMNYFSTFGDLCLSTHWFQNLSIARSIQ